MDTGSTKKTLLFIAAITQVITVTKLKVLELTLVAVVGGGRGAKCMLKPR